MNDLSSMGARPLYLTASFILETGLDADILGKIVQSMKETAEEAGVRIVAGDTKVIEGKGGLYINTAGIGERPSLTGYFLQEYEIGGYPYSHRNTGRSSRCCFDKSPGH